jgi:hypothetical protein
MPIDRAKAFVAVAATIALTGCAATPATAPLVYEGNWGDANRLTMAAQIIDPAPVYETALAETRGPQVASAIERYRTDRVKRPEKVKTTNVGAQGSGQ